MLGKMIHNQFEDAVRAWTNAVRARTSSASSLIVDNYFSAVSSARYGRLRTDEYQETAAAMITAVVDKAQDQTTSWRSPKTLSFRHFRP
ncbi:hypothetical protein H351_30750 (plasmid) [Rhodococcus erythropolis R138]|nr:hypothetical protein H351_30750 [Rhodococcus erythropolis R138]